MLTLHRLVAAIALICIAIVPASAQTGSAKTVGALNTEVNSLFPDNTAGAITPFDLRQVTLDIIASYINGTTFTGCSVTGSGTLVCPELQNAKSGAYLATTTDCGGRILLGGNAFYTLSLGNPAGYATNCRIRVTNTDAYPGPGRGKILSVFGMTFGNPILYPGQSTEFVAIGGNASWFESDNGRDMWKPNQYTTNAPITFYIDCNAGSDSNDGLATGAGGAFQTPFHAYVITAAYASGSGAGVTQFTWSSTGTGCGTFHMSGPIRGADGNAALVWNGNGTTTIATTPGNPCIALFDKAWVEINGVACTDANTTGCYSVTSYGHLFFVGTASSCTSAYGGVSVGTYAQVEFVNTGFNFSGVGAAAEFLFNVQTNGNLFFDLTESISLGTNIAFSLDTVLSSQHGTIDFHSSTFNLNGHTITGTRFACNFWSLILGTGGLPNTVIPGNVNGTVGSDCLAP